MELQLLEGANAIPSHSHGQIDPIETQNRPKGNNLNEWQKLDRLVRTTIPMHLSESVYFTVQEDTLRNLREEGRGHKYILDLLPL